MGTPQRAAFDRAIAAWNAGDLNGYLELYDDAVELHGYSKEPMGKADVRNFYEGIFAALSDIELEIHEVVCDGIQLGCRFTMHGTHSGELAGIPATGRRIHQPGITICRFDGERVVARYSVTEFGAVVEPLS